MKTICVAAIGTRGDCYPALALAGILRKENQIKILTSPDMVPLFRQQAYDCCPVGDDFSKVVGSRDIAYYRTQIEAQFDGCRTAVEGADVLVGAGLFYAGRTLAECFGKPYYHLFFTPQVLQSDAYAPPGIAKPFRGRMHNRLLWKKSFAESDFLLKALIDRKRGELGLAPIHSVYGYLIDQPGTVIALDDRIAEIPGQYASRIRQIHTLRFEDPAPLDDALQAFLDRGSKPVLINFGSAEYAARGYREMLKRTMDTGLGLGHRIVILTKAAANASTKSENVFFCPYAPHAALLPKTKAIIHHGGIGTVCAALGSATPQIIMPQVLDQHFFAEVIREKQWGRAVDATGKAFSLRLGNALRDAVENQAIQKGVTDISRWMNSAQYREEGLQKLRGALPACF